jgi:hypothetical protein
MDTCRKGWVLCYAVTQWLRREHVRKPKWMVPPSAKVFVVMLNLFISLRNATEKGFTRAQD